MTLPFSNPRLERLNRLATGRCPRGKGRWYAFVLLAAAFCLFTASTCAAPPAAASVPYAVSQTGAGNSHLPVFSADGRHVAFVSQANNLVTNDDLGPWLDLFIRDLNASNTVLVSVSTNGFGGANADVALCSVSSNAQVVAFETAASNLAPADHNFTSDIYARNLLSGVTELVSTSAFGTGAGNGPSFNPLVSADGRYVIFESLASNLVTNDFNGTNDIFLRDLLSGATTLISVNDAGTASAAGSSTSPAISASGLFVAFVSTATNVVAGVTNRLGEVYVRDVATGTSVWAQASQHFATRDPATGAYAASQPALSAEGRYVTIKTPRALVRFDTVRPTNSVVQFFPGQTPQDSPNVFSFLDNPRIGLLSSRGFTPGAQALTPDGRHAACGAETNDAGGGANIFRVDFETLQTNVVLMPCCDGGTGSPYYVTSASPALALVSTNFAGNNPARIRSTTPVISADGQRVAFLCDASNEPGGTTNGQFRLYLRDLRSNAVQTISTKLSGGPSAVIPDIVPALSPDGSRVTWESIEETLVESDINQASDVFVRESDGGTTQPVSARHVARPATTGIRLASAPLLSADGRRLAFLASDGNLAPGDANFARDLFVRDLDTGTNVAIGFGLSVAPSNNIAGVSLSGDGRYVSFLRFVSVGNIYATNAYRGDATSGEISIVSRTFTGAPSANVGAAAISSDGQRVAFDTAQAGNTLSTDPVSDGNGQSDVFLSDHSVSNTPMHVISVNAARTTSGNRASAVPVFSPDARWIAFLSRASDLTADAGSANGVDWLLFARDLAVERTRLVSYRTTASPAPDGRSTDLPLAGGGTNAIFSADGRQLFFTGATNLIYRHDLSGDAVLTVTQGGGTFFTNIARLTNLMACVDCANATVSADGRFIAYESRTPGDTNDVFVKDLLTGQAQLVSQSTTGHSGNGPSFTPLLSYDARYVVFASRAGNLTANDTNGATDIFLRNRLTGTTLCLSLNAAGTATGNRASSNPVLSGDGRTVAFQSFAGDLVAGDYNDTRDVFVVTLGSPDTDGDGMEDDWEVAFFGTMLRDGTADFDGDGASDLAEFGAGTDPTNTGSILRVLMLTTAAGQPTGADRTTTLLWSASPGKTYRVQFKTVVEAAWTDLPGDIVAAGTTATKRHSAPVGESRGFYRVLLTP